MGEKLRTAALLLIGGLACGMSALMLAAGVWQAMHGEHLEPGWREIAFWAWLLTCAISGYVTVGRALSPTQDKDKADG